MALTPRDRHDESRPPRPWRRRFVVAGSIIVLGLALVAGWMYFQSYGVLAKAIAETDALDPNWRIADYEAHRREVADAENSALVLKAGHRLRNAAATTKPVYDLEELFDDVATNPAARLNDPQKAALKTLLSHYTLSLDEYRKLANMPSGRFAINYAPNIIGTLLNDQQSSRDGVRAMRLDLWDKIETGDAAGAALCLRAMLNGSRAIGDEPFAISMLIRVSTTYVTLGGFERFLAQLESDEPTLARLQRALEQDEAEPLLVNAARGERAFSYEALEEVKRNPRSGSAALGVGSGKGNWWEDLIFMVPGYVSTQQAALLRAMNEFHAIAQRPTHEQIAMLVRWEADAKQLPMLARMMAPAIQKIAFAFLRSRAAMRTMIVAIAAERYRLKSGQWPEKLEDLVTAKLIAAVPLDPFNGKPLRYVAVPGGRVIYSVGKDLVDNNGNLDPKFFAAVDGDVGWRLYDVKERRAAPAPPKPKDPPAAE